MNLSLLMIYDLSINCWLPMVGHSPAESSMISRFFGLHDACCRLGFDLAQAERSHDIALLRQVPRREPLAVRDDAMIYLPGMNCGNWKILENPWKSASQWFFIMFLSELKLHVLAGFYGFACSITREYMQLSLFGGPQTWKKIVSWSVWKTPESPNPMWPKRGWLELQRDLDVLSSGAMHWLHWGSSIKTSSPCQCVHCNCVRACRFASGGGTQHVFQSGIPSCKLT